MEADAENLNEANQISFKAMENEIKLLKSKTEIKTYLEAVTEDVDNTNKPKTIVKDKQKVPVTKPNVQNKPNEKVKLNEETIKQIKD